MMICLFGEDAEVIVNLNQVSRFSYKDGTLTIFYVNHDKDSFPNMERGVYEQIKSAIFREIGDR